jgi:RND family efflux transporter MFP subunit
MLPPFPEALVNSPDTDPSSLNREADEMILLSRAIVAVFVTAACCGLSWFVYRDSIVRVSLSDPAQPKPIVAVEVTPVEQGVIQQELQLVGSLIPKNEVEIFARVPGYITAIPFHVGDSVEANETVVQLDEAAALETIASAEAELLVVEAERRADVAKLELAKKEWERQQQLVSSSAVTQSDLDTVGSNFKVAEANVALADARTVSAQSKLNHAKLALDDLRLKSPLSGVVATKLAEVGELAAADLSLLHIVNLDHLETVVNIVERDYTKIQRGDIAEVHVDAFPTRTFQGSIVRIRPVIDRETLTAAVHIGVPNADHLLKPGMHARVVVRLTDSLPEKCVPIAAIMYRNDTASVFVASGRPTIAKRRSVTLGPRNGTDVAVMSGLEVGELVVTLGHQLLKDGQEVNAVQSHHIRPK